MTETPTASYDFEKDRPERQYLDDPNIKWRESKPDYTLADRTFLAGHCKRHAHGSLERTVENLVKTWEMEVTHKPDTKDWHSIDQSGFVLSVNDQHHYSAERVAEISSYNALIHDSPFYDAKGETFDSAHKLFREAFNKGFAWEVLEVFAGPPRLAFSWRHWAHWTGPYRGHPPTGELLQMFGMGIAEVNEELKFKSIQLYYDPNQILAKLANKGGNAENKGCPFGGTQCCDVL